MLPNQHEKEFIENFIDSCATCLISSIDENGYPKTRALVGVRYREDLTKLYFATKGSSQKTKQFRNNSKGCVYFYDPNKFIGEMFIGNMIVSQERSDKEKVWKEGDITYFPKGFNDPEFSVLIFETNRIRQDYQLHIKEYKIK